MKNIVIFLVALLTISSVVMGQVPQKIDINKVMTAYTLALQSNNAGLRDSAAYQLACLKAAFPDFDYTSAERVLNKVAKNDASSLVRIHAGLTLTYLRDAQLSEKVKPENPEESLEFYNKLHNELYSSFFAAMSM